MGEVLDLARPHLSPRRIDLQEPGARGGPDVPSCCVPRGKDVESKRDDGDDDGRWHRQPPRHPEGPTQGCAQALAVGRKTRKEEACPAERNQEQDRVTDPPCHKLTEPRDEGREDTAQPL